MPDDVHPAKEIERLSTAKAEREEDALSALNVTEKTIELETDSLPTDDAGATEAVVKNAALTGEAVVEPAAATAAESAGIPDSSTPSPPAPNDSIAYIHRIESVEATKVPDDVHPAKGKEQLSTTKAEVEADALLALTNLDTAKITESETDSLPTDDASATEVVVNNVALTGETIVEPAATAAVESAGIPDSSTPPPPAPKDSIAVQDDAQLDFKAKERLSTAEAERETEALLTLTNLDTESDIASFLTGGASATKVRVIKDTILNAEMAKAALTENTATANPVAHPITLLNDDEYPDEVGHGTKEASLAHTRRRFRAVLNAATTVVGQGNSDDGNKKPGWMPNIPMGRGGRVQMLASMRQGSVLRSSLHAGELQINISTDSPTDTDVIGDGLKSGTDVMDIASVPTAIKKVRMWAKFTPGVQHKAKAADAAAATAAAKSVALAVASPATASSTSTSTSAATATATATATALNAADNYESRPKTSKKVKWAKTQGNTLRPRSGFNGDQGDLMDSSPDGVPNDDAARRDKSATVTHAYPGMINGNPTRKKTKRKAFFGKKNKVAPRAHVGWTLARKRFNKNDHDGGINGQTFMASPGGSRIAPTGVEIDAWNEVYDDAFDGDRARRLQVRFDSRNDLGVIGMWLSSLSRSWNRFTEYFVGSGSKLGNAGIGWLFRDMIKDLGAHFGGGVSSFFKFMKYLIIVNFWLFTIEMLFVVIPGFVSWPEVRNRQIVHANLTCSMFNDTEDGGFLPSGFDIHNVTIEHLTQYWQKKTGMNSPFEPVPREFTISNYLDGQGVMGYSPIFYGGYIAKLKSGYRTDVAYIFTFIVCTCGLLFSVMGKAFRKDRSVGSIIFKASPTAPFSTGVFASWDYSLTSVNAREALRLGIFTSLIDGFEENKLEVEEEKEKKRKKKTKDAAEKEKNKVEAMRRKKEIVDLKAEQKRLEGIIHAESFLMRKGYIHPRIAELEKIVEELKEHEQTVGKAKFIRKASFKIIARRVLGWFIWTIILSATFTGCGFIMKKFIAAKTDARENGTDLSIVDEYMLAGTLAAANVVLPTIFSALAKFEQYREGDQITMIKVARMFVMRIGTIYAVCLALYVELKLPQEQFPPTHQTLWGVQQDCCAGTVLGQEAYKLVVTDIFFTNMAEIGMAILMAKILNREKPEEERKMEMDVAQALIYLCYRQGLIWIGMLFAPPLAFLGLLGAALSFYVYYFLAFWAYKTPTALSSRVSSEIFTKALALTFGLTSPLLILITRVWSPNCGPMAGYSTLLSGLEMWSRDNIIDAETGEEIIISDSSDVLVMLSDPAVLYAIVFVLAFVITIMTGRIASRQEECILQANALDIAHSELNTKKDEIVYDHFVAASRMIRNQLHLDQMAIQHRRQGTWPKIALIAEDIDLLNVVQCCLTYDGQDMLQAAEHDAILYSQDAAWLKQLLTAPLSTRKMMAESWVMNPDGTRNTVCLAVYPKKDTSIADWNGLFDQIYNSHKAVWTYSQNVFEQMTRTPFADLEKEAKATFLYGYTFAQTYVMGDSNDSTEDLLKEKKDPIFMTTDRLIHIAEKQEARIAELTKEEMARDETLNDYVTPAQLRAWLYFHLNIDESFGQRSDGERLIANRPVAKFGDLYACFDITDFLDPAISEDQNIDLLDLE